MEIISTYIVEHNLGEQPCTIFSGNAQQAKFQDTHHVWHYLIDCG